MNFTMRRTKKAILRVLLGLGSLVILGMNKNYKIALASFRGLSNDENVKKRKVAFVHVGKTGGTTLGPLVAATCYSMVSPCERKKNIANETEISKQVQDYFHVRKPDTENFSSFIVMVRDPIDRIVSWFLYQHPDNGFGRNGPEALELWNCYHDVDDLATRGLAPISEMQDLSVREKECMKLAADAFAGKTEILVFLHLNMNYQWYTEDILQETDNEIFVLRTEHFWDDWQKINHMLGGGKTNAAKSVTHFEGKTRAVDSRYVSPEGVENLCRVLCTEIKFYEELIERAVNIETDEKVSMLLDLTKKCPNMSC